MQLISVNMHVMTVMLLFVQPKFKAVQYLLWVKIIVDLKGTVLIKQIKVSVARRLKMELIVCNMYLNHNFQS